MLELEEEKIDSVGFDEIENLVVLDMFDDMNWENKIEKHLSLFQNKVNLYLHFIDSGQLYELDENYKNNDICIKVRFKYKIPNEARKFIEEAVKYVANLTVSNKSKIIMKCLEYDE